MLHALYVVARNVLISPFVLARTVSRLFGAAPAWVDIPIRGNPAHRPGAWWSDVAGTMGGGAAPGLTVQELTEVAEAIAVDPAVQGVLWRIGPLSGAGWAKAEALRKAVARVRDAGKRSVAWLVEPGHREWLVAGGANEIRLHEASAAVVTGVAAEVSFFGAAAERLGVQAQMERVGEYKGALEPWTRSEPTPQFSEAMGGMVGSLQDDLVAAVAESRGWDDERARAVLDGGPYTAAGAEVSGLVDGLSAARNLAKSLSDAGGAGGEGPILRGPGWFTAGPTFLPLRRRPQIAVIGVRGLIRTHSPGPSAARAGAFADEIASALKAVASDPLVAAVVLHIDSRGGSAVGSDVIWDAVRAARDEKPVIAWMGEAAASGGYYVACAADHVVAAPGTLTGSIGVIAGKVVYRDLLERVGVHRTLFSAGPRGGMFSPSRPFDEAELGWLREELDAVYEQFVARVSEGRGMSHDAVDRYARGRVWTGRQALERGLVDSLGGWPEALALARDKAGLGADRQVEVLSTRPRPRRFLPFGLPGMELARGLTGAPAGAPNAAALASWIDPVLAEAAWLAGPDGPRVAVWSPLPQV